MENKYIKEIYEWQVMLCEWFIQSVENNVAMHQAAKELKALLNSRPVEG